MFSFYIFFFKQKTAYEMRISDWSSDVCSSDLGVFKGETINTPSMLAVEDAIFALEWAKSLGGLDGLKARSDANAAALDRIVAEREWLSHLAADPASRSKHSVCLSAIGRESCRERECQSG